MQTNTIQLESIAVLVSISFYFLLRIKAVYRWYQNDSLLKKNKTLKKLKRLSWDEFEVLSMQLFEKMGWIASGNEKKGADGGVDIWMHKKSFIKKKTKAIVQCKRYDDAMVTIKVIREMYGLMHEYGVTEAYIVTTSRFTKECYIFVEGKKIKLIDGEKLLGYINRYT